MCDTPVTDASTLRSVPCMSSLASSDKLSPSLLPSRRSTSSNSFTLLKPSLNNDVARSTSWIPTCSYLFSPNHKTKTAQRIYIDAIYKTCTRWANWFPATKIEAGDFGTIQESTGEFMVEGNIYSHPDLQAIASQHPVIHCPAIDVFSAYSDQTQELPASEVWPEGTAVQGISFQTRLKFSNKRAAVLLMLEPKMIVVPTAFFHTAAGQPHLSVLKGKVVAHEVWHCPGFFLNLSDGASGELRFALHSHPITSTSTSPEAGMGFQWVAEGSSGDLWYRTSLYGCTTPYLATLPERECPLARDTAASGCGAANDDAAGGGVRFKLISVPLKE
ncbi:hypothetical protein BC826DRAFT_1179659 [Russula brevipes]|nr:hypothetical protein BC826DRAFT_1179659 [Russula brevipes]